MNNILITKVCKINLISIINYISDAFTYIYTRPLTPPPSVFFQYKYNDGRDFSISLGGYNHAVPYLLHRSTRKPAGIVPHKDRGQKYFLKSRVSKVKKQV